MIDAYDPAYVIGAEQAFPISVINDLHQPWVGSVRLRIVKDGKTVVEKTQPCKVEALGATRLDFTLKIPDAGDYELEAALVKGSEPPVRSVRDFKAAATVSSR
jgi:hypothetical protein